MAAPRTAAFLALAAGAVLAFAACAGPAESGGPAASPPPDTPVNSGDATGTWTSDDRSAWLTLADGELTGNDGCNAVNGSYTVEGDAIDFVPGIMTLKACPGVTLSFHGLSSAVVDDDLMTLYDADGAQLAVLTRD